MANPKADELTYPHPTIPRLGTTLEVAPGVRWLRMGLPFALDHINLWLLRDRIDGREGWTIVDCGIDNGDTRAAWETIFERDLGGLPVLRVIVTHMHPDHIGLAHWLTQRWGCLMWISATDFHVAHMASRQNDGTGGDEAVAFYAAHGVRDADSAAKLQKRRGYYASLVPQVPVTYRRMMDGNVITIGGHTWHAIAGYGHAPEHIALHCPALNVLIAGDMVLPRISTNVMVWYAEPLGNPLPLFTDSLARMRAALPATTLVLPSHGLPFVGLHERVTQLIEHHDERYERVLEACGVEPRSAKDLLAVLFRRELDFHQLTFALGEAIAHAHALWYRGALTMQVGDDGVRRFLKA